MVILAVFESSNRFYITYCWLELLRRRSFWYYWNYSVHSRFEPSEEILDPIISRFLAAKLERLDENICSTLATIKNLDFDSEETTRPYY